MTEITNINDLSIYISNLIPSQINDINSIYDTKQTNIIGSASTIITDILQQNSVVITNELGKISSSIVTPDELSYLSNLTSPITSNIEYLSEYITSSSNLLKASLTTTSNSIVSQIDTIDSSRTSNILDTSNVISIKINDLTTDNIQDGVTKRFIVDNNYNNNLTITGKLTTDELLVLGDTFTIDTTSYKTSNLNISTLLDENEVGLKISGNDLTGTGTIFQINGIDNNNITILGNGNVGIGKTEPLYTLDVSGSINITNDSLFMINNRQLAYADLIDIPMSFIPSAHPTMHSIVNVIDLQSTLDFKHDDLGLVWNTEENRIDVINKNINLNEGYKFKINDISISYIASIASSIPLLWSSADETLSRDMIVISSNAISINNTLQNKKGIALDTGNIITYSGDIITYNGNVSSENSIINNNLIFNNKWRVYAKNDDLYDLNFENSTDNGLNWSLRAKMNGSGSYSTSVYTNFTGIHHCKALTKELYDDKYIGYIVSTTNKYSSMNSIYSPENLQRNFDKDVWDFLPVVELSSKARDKSLFGIIVKVENTDVNDRYEISGIISYPIEKNEHDRRLHIAGCGEGGIWISNYNGTFEAGDLITTSPIAGIGMKQDDELVYNYTVGKITMDCDFNPRLLNNDEYEYEIKYIEPNDDNDTIIDVNRYNELLNNNLPVYIIAFVGCSYNAS